MLSAITGGYQSVEGEVTFTPEEGRAYVVAGRLHRGDTAVRIADWKTRERVSDEVTVKSKRL